MRLPKIVISASAPTPFNIKVAERYKDCLHAMIVQHVLYETTKKNFYDPRTEIPMAFYSQTFWTQKFPGRHINTIKASLGILLKDAVLIQDINGGLMVNIQNDWFMQCYQDYNLIKKLTAPEESGFNPNDYIYYPKTKYMQEFGMLPGVVFDRIFFLITQGNIQYFKPILNKNENNLMVNLPESLLNRLFPFMETRAAYQIINRQLIQRLKHIIKYDTSLYGIDYNLLFEQQIPYYNDLENYGNFFKNIQEQHHEQKNGHHIIKTFLNGMPTRDMKLQKKDSKDYKKIDVKYCMEFFEKFFSKPQNNLFSEGINITIPNSKSLPKNTIIRDMLIDNESDVVENGIDTESYLNNFKIDITENISQLLKFFEQKNFLKNFSDSEEKIQKNIKVLVANKLQKKRTFLIPKLTMKITSKNDLDNSNLPQKIFQSLNTENKICTLRTKAEHWEQNLNTENSLIIIKERKREKKNKKILKNSQIRKNCIFAHHGEIFFLAFFSRQYLSNTELKIYNNFISHMLYNLFIGLVLPVKSIYNLKNLKNLKYNNSFNKKIRTGITSSKTQNEVFEKNTQCVFAVSDAITAAFGERIFFLRTLIPADNPHFDAPWHTGLTSEEKRYFNEEMTKNDALNILQHFPLPVQVMILYTLAELLEKEEPEIGINRLMGRCSSGYAAYRLFEYMKGTSPCLQDMRYRRTTLKAYLEKKHPDILYGIPEDIIPRLVMYNVQPFLAWLQIPYDMSCDYFVLAPKFSQEITLEYIININYYISIINARLFEAVGGH